MGASSADRNASSPSQFMGQQVQRLRLVVPDDGRAGPVVVLQDFPDCAHLPGVHEGARTEEVAQRGGLARTGQFIARPREPQFRAIVGLCVAVPAQAIERVVPYDLDAFNAPLVRKLPGSGKNAGVVEFVVGEKRPIVAIQALGLADEQAQSFLLRAVELLAVDAGVCRRAGEQRLDIAIERRLTGQQQPLVGGQRLAEIDEDPVDRFPVGRRHPGPGRLGLRVAPGARAFGKPAEVSEVGQKSEQVSILLAIERIFGNESGQRRPGNPLLQRAFERTQGLGPQAVPAAVPEEPWAVRGTDQAHGIEIADRQTQRPGQGIGETPRRLMAGRTGDLPVGAQPDIEEQAVTEALRTGVVSHRIARGRRQRRQVADPEGIERPAFHIRPGRLWHRRAKPGPGRRQNERHRDEPGQVPQESSVLIQLRNGSSIAVCPSGGIYRSNSKVNESLPSPAAMSITTSQAPPMWNFMPSTR